MSAEYMFKMLHIQSNLTNDYNSQYLQGQSCLSDPAYGALLEGTMVAEQELQGQHYLEMNRQSLCLLIRYLNIRPLPQIAWDSWTFQKCINWALFSTKRIISRILSERIILWTNKHY